MSNNHHHFRALGDRPTRLHHGITFTGCLGSVVGSFALAQIAIAGPVNLDSSIPSSQLSVSNCGAVDCTVSSTAVGDHYFHSFDSFTINEGVTLTFSAPSGVERIFSRLTGSASSIINGTLQVEGNADFFLLSPNGILIGRNGQIETGGSFTGSTARSLEFGNGSFSAGNLDAPPILTISEAPRGLRVISSSAGIEVLGATGSGGSPNDSPPVWLNTEGGTFSLIGGRQSETYVERRILDIQNGGITIASIRPGLLDILDNSNGYEFPFSGQNTTLNNDVRLENVIIRSAPGATHGNLTLHGDLVEISSNSEISLSAAQSDIFFQGTNIELSQSELNQTANQGSLIMDAMGNVGNDIDLNSVNVSLNIGNGNLEFNAGDDIDLTTANILFNTENGNLQLNAEDKIRAFENSSVVLETLAGSLELEAETRIDIQNSEILLSLQDSPISGSNLNLTTDELILREGSLIQTEFSGVGSEGGELNINVDDLLTIELDDNDIFIQGPSPREIEFSDEQPPTSGINSSDSSAFARGNGQSDIGYIFTPVVVTPSTPSPPAASPSPPTPPSPPVPAVTPTTPPTPTTLPSRNPPPAPNGSPPQVDSPDNTADTADTAVPSVSDKRLPSTSLLPADNENAIKTELGPETSRDRPYAIASLCQAQQASQLLIASDRGGIAASPRSLVMADRSIPDLGNATVASSTPVSEDSPQNFAAPSPLPKLEAVRWQVSSQGKIQLIAQGENHPIERFTLRCGT